MKRAPKSGDSCAGMFGAAGRRATERRPQSSINNGARLRWSGPSSQLGGRLGLLAMVQKSSGFEDTLKKLSHANS